MSTKLFFSSIDVTRQAFYRSAHAHAFAIVNLKPLVPGHVLVIPNCSRPVPRISDLEDGELSALMKSVKIVGNALERAYGADALTIACQASMAAGQSIKHVHFHIIPRKLRGDRFSDANDAIYPELEKAEGRLAGDMASKPSPLKVDADEDRMPRTMEEMEKEAIWLSGFFDNSSI
ncbi:diadenosine 5',5'''-P1,P4-tetraphosphate asymmetrical hydrolase [Mycena floridula]|nr:diadenosine 5',5'''-P1,P4-tetraphosphate asymmetrical hydrolase [Mycena floridula]